jgi:hypothetical protein
VILDDETEVVLAPLFKNGLGLGSATYNPIAAAVQHLIRGGGRDLAERLVAAVVVLSARSPK